MQAKQDFYYLLSVAQQTQRYEDMVQFSKQLCQCGEELNVQERKLVVQSYKLLISSSRTALRALLELDAREERKSSQPGGNPRNIVQLRQYRAKLEQYIIQQCNEFISTIDQVLMPQAQSAEQKVFYLKTQADFQRYISECLTGSQKEQISQIASQNYEQAHLMAKKELDPVHPTRLGLALNYSVFQYETLNDISTAISLSREISDLAFNDIEKLDDETHKLATDILFQIRDNINEWNLEWETMENQDEK